MQFKSIDWNRCSFNLCKTALNNAPLKDSDGIVANTPEKCIQNIADLSKLGMHSVDATIVKIMEC